ncbi:hypothetical protein ERO13_A10G238000v2 [Gossypium hirsutum]|uniref:Abscisic acid receptor PYL4 n=2 Tax=Gossypium TaxID=3633 RepID=A0A2P5XG44_GOSBA|nr:abscisic acid receptor PYL4-like [Gossypium hirsutum]KAB2064036.1 hypothetical protein ES319_A10G262200v1 [Gossypium barbadense]KAG4181596.1 hypothetical protein ERO13_A10G238000v2 [Gossypium hirsutum]PPS02318.1 hypothetical protein GOBAR_AA18332 [Gossypium barbadense]
MPSPLQLHRSTATTLGSSHHHHHHHKQPQPLPTTTLTRCSPLPCGVSLPDAVSLYHVHTRGPNQCCSAVVQPIEAPIETVWSLVRRFDNPQAYKNFVKSCHVIVGDGDVGTLREVHVISGLPAASSTERLEILDDERHVLSFSVVGGDHRLRNYKSVTTLHASTDGKGTVAVESYVVDVPSGNTKEDTCTFVDMIVSCNLRSLAQMAANSAKKEKYSSSP